MPEELELMNDLFKLIDAAILQGRAIERVDQPAAAEAHRDVLAALGRVLDRVAPDLKRAAVAAVDSKP